MPWYFKVKWGGVLKLESKYLTFDFTYTKFKHHYSKSKKTRSVSQTVQEGFLVDKSFKATTYVWKAIRVIAIESPARTRVLLIFMLRETTSRSMFWSFVRSRPHWQRFGFASEILIFNLHFTVSILKFHALLQTNNIMYYQG